MRTMPVAWVKAHRATRRNHPLFGLLLRVAATLAWNAL